MSIETDISEQAQAAPTPDLQMYGPEGRLDIELVQTDRPGVYDIAGAIITSRFVSIAEAFPDRPILPLDLC